MLIHYLNNRVAATGSDPIRPFQCQPHPLCLEARDEVWHQIQLHPLWEQTFSRGKMIGILLVADAEGSTGYLTAYSGTASLDSEAHRWFVPPVCDLDRPDDFYRLEEARITDINGRIRSLEKMLGEQPKSADHSAAGGEIASLREERHTRSLALQQEIFRRFRMLNARGERQDLIEIFHRFRGGLPPGGTGECAAPRLLQYAHGHGLKPLHLAEFWYGASSPGEPHAHGAAYPSCMEKCGPVLSFMLDGRYRVPEAQPLREADPRIVWENSDLVVVSKPPGMLSVPGKDSSMPDVESWLLRRYPECEAPMLVHRLDMATSGLLVAAKSAATHRRLQALWLSRSVHKTYRAWVAGRVPSSQGLLSLPLCPNPEDRPRQAIDWQWGKVAVTRYHVLRTTPEATLLSLSPLTGRTHQLRLHLSDPRGLGHPILGDALYGRNEPVPAFLPSGQLLLHALSVSWRDDKWQRDFKFDDYQTIYI